MLFKRLLTTFYIYKKVPRKGDKKEKVNILEISKQSTCTWDEKIQKRSWFGENIST
jgi:hypothetical protein